MQPSPTSPSSVTVAPHAAALRVVGAPGVLFVVLMAAVLLARPEMTMAAMHGAMSLIFVP